MGYHSYAISQGRDRAPARAMLKAIGFSDVLTVPPALRLNSAIGWIGVHIEVPKLPLSSSLDLYSHGQVRRNIKKPTRLI